MKAKPKPKLNDRAKAWVKALRSGKYKQGFGWLKKESKYCCLGVACELYCKRVKDIKNGTEANGATIYGDTSLSLPAEVQRWLGLEHREAFIEDEGDCLSFKNDHGTSFEKIARIIESKPKGLFKKGR